MYVKLSISSMAFKFIMKQCLKSIENKEEVMEMYCTVYIDEIGGVQITWVM